MGTMRAGRTTVSGRARGTTGCVRSFRAIRLVWRGRTFARWTGRCGTTGRLFVLRTVRLIPRHVLGVFLMFVTMRRTRKGRLGNVHVHINTASVGKQAQLGVLRHVVRASDIVRVFAQCELASDLFSIGDGEVGADGR